MENTLYWLYNPTTKLTKIGITENLDQRLKQIENACGCEVKLVAYATFEHASITERFLLSLLSNCRTKGEWIEINEEGVLEFLFNFFNNTFSSFKTNKDKWIFKYKSKIDLIDMFKIYNEHIVKIREVTNEL